ncbi:MAG: sigma-70 family RNA polymerase sigma factor [Anaerolineales bacterium]|nr:sigma-70 family RNA polymerase sigma factor [Anaerolineales bacterium]MCB8967792.1 sigma-70 family RNA polymerase sigma factor [Ardenticatenaceae bacterium]
MQAVATLVQDARSHKDRQYRHEAFSELVSRFQDAAYVWAYHVLGDVHLAQDATQEAFVTAYQNLHQLREPDAFIGWFKQIVISQCHRLIRSHKISTKPIDLTTDLSTDDEPAVLIESIELQDKVMAAIRALPEHEQEVTEMFYLRGYSQNEIAKTLQLPLTTVKKRLQYAREHLRLIMEAMFAPTPTPVPVPVPVRAKSQYPVPHAQSRRRYYDESF